MAIKAGLGSVFQVNRLDMRIGHHHGDSEVMQILLHTDRAFALAVCAVIAIDKGGQAGFFIVRQPCGMPLGYLQMKGE